MPASALEDFPIYLDGGCGSAAVNGLGNGYAQGPADMLFGKKVNGDKTVPVTCDEKLSGSDAIVVKLARPLAGSFSDKMDTLTVPVSAEWKGLNDTENGWFVNRMAEAAKTPLLLPAIGIAEKRAPRLPYSEAGALDLGERRARGRRAWRIPGDPAEPAGAARGLTSAARGACGFPH